MEPEEKTQSEKGKIKPDGYILLDTNILIKLGEGDKHRAFVRGEIFSHLDMIIGENPGWYLAISSITMFELINQSKIEVELERENMLKGIKCFPITNPVLRIAGRLSCFYSQQNIPNEKIEVPDKIIAGTAAQTGSVIFTTNPSDYPAPFFAEFTKYRKVIEHPGKSGYPAFTVLYIMIPQKGTISDFWNQRVQPIKKKSKMEKRKSA